MSTATAEPEVIEALVQQPDPSVLFVSKRDELRLVHTGRYPIMVPNTGQRLGETRGIVVSFAPNGEFRCPVQGDVTIMDPGGAGQATMPAADLLAWLESHARCGDPNEGFQRLDPKAPPLGQDEQQRLMDAAAAWDVETLEAIVAQERAGWNRSDLINIAEGTIAKVREAEAHIRADQDRVREEEEQASRAIDARVRDAEERADRAEREAQERIAAAELLVAEAKAKPKAAGK